LKLNLFGKCNYTPYSLKAETKEDNGKCHLTQNGNYTNQTTSDTKKKTVFNIHNKKRQKYKHVKLFEISVFNNKIDMHSTIKIISKIISFE
jgi:hypothetical protein